MDQRFKLAKYLKFNKITKFLRFLFQLKQTFIERKASIRDEHENLPDLIKIYKRYDSVIQKV